MLNPAKELSPQKNNNHLSGGKFHNTYKNEVVEIDSNYLSLEERMFLTKHGNLFIPVRQLHLNIFAPKLEVYGLDDLSLAQNWTKIPGIRISVR